MKTVILAEKPSQAKAYAETFQQRKRYEGYYEISDPLFAGEVTHHLWFWTFGRYGCSRSL